MVQIKTCSDFPFIEQVSAGDLCGPERAGDKFFEKGGDVHKQEEIENPVWTERDNVLLKQVTDKEVIIGLILDSSTLRIFSTKWSM